MRLDARLERLMDKADSLLNPHVVAFTLVVPEGAVLPSAFASVRPGLVAVVMSLTPETRARVVEALTADPSPRTSATLTVIELRESVSRAIVLAVTGQASELAMFGSRGDGKSWGSLALLAIHARLHVDAGYPLPTRTLAATGSHTEHRAKLCRSMMAAEWGGCWALRDDQHVAVFVSDGVEWAAADLIGVNDVGAMDKLRTECHAVWFEEAIPASADASAGLSLDSWMLARTSQRLASCSRPAFVSTNYGDESAWPWRRFVTEATTGRVAVRIVPGERASAEARAEWAEALADRPDLLDRLVRGEPAAVLTGEAVAHGYSPRLHVADAPLKISPAHPLIIGLDGGLTPTAVVLQHVRGRLLVFAGLSLERGGMRQLCETVLLPWLGRRAAWTLEASGQEIHWYIDPSIRTPDASDIDQRGDLVVKRLIGGRVRDGMVKWQPRIGPLLAAFNRMVDGKPALQINPGPDTEHLRRALEGRWHYPRRPNGEIARDDPVKDHPWSDLGDCLCYAVGGAAPSRDPEERRQLDALYRQRPQRAATAFDATAPDYGYGPPQREGSWLRTYTPRTARTENDDD